MRTEAQQLRHDLYSLIASVNNGSVADLQEWLQLAVRGDFTVYGWGGGDDEIYIVAHLRVRGDISNCNMLIDKAFSTG